MGWLWAIIVGLVLGVIARAILPGKQDIPLWLTVVFGILGSILGNAVATWIGVNDTKGIDWISGLIGVVVAAALIVGYGMISGNRQTGQCSARLARPDSSPSSLEDGVPWKWHPPHPPHQPPAVGD